MLVGEGAERFAVAMGFPRENLLTERSRKTWQLWKEFHSTDDWWGPAWPRRNGKLPIRRLIPSHGMSTSADGKACLRDWH